VEVNDELPVNTTRFCFFANQLFTTCYALILFKVIRMNWHVFALLWASIGKNGQKKFLKIFAPDGDGWLCSDSAQKNVAEMWHSLSGTAILGGYRQQWQKNIGNLILSSNSRNFSKQNGVALFVPKLAFTGESSSLRRWQFLLTENLRFCAFLPQIAVKLMKTAPRITLM